MFLPGDMIKIGPAHLRRVGLYDDPSSDLMAQTSWWDDRSVIGVFIHGRVYDRNSMGLVMLSNMKLGWVYLVNIETL